MIFNRAILKVGNSEYDILRFNQKFQRDVDPKGRPCSVYYGGEIYVQFESTDNMQLFRKMIDEDLPTIDGSIEVFAGSDKVCVKRIEFKEAYVYSYGEDIQCIGWAPMTTTVAISPMRLDYNNNILRLDRKWPRASCWQKYEEEKVKYMKKEGSIPNIRITDAYWIDGKKRKHFDLFVDHPVTLFVELEDCMTNETVNLKFENDEKTHSFEHSGKVRQNGIMEIENFQLKRKNNL